MAENKISIDGTASTAVPVSGTVGVSGTVAVSGTVNTIPAAPSGSNFYVYSLTEAPGVVAANNFLSIFNPVGSGKNLVFYFVDVTPYATGATTTTNGMKCFRITAASGGTLVAASTIPKFITAQPDSIAQVRIANPTVTVSGLELFGEPPVITAAAGGAGASGGGQPPSGASFVCVPGQGVVLSTAAGDVDQLWNMRFNWSEV